MTMDRGSIRIAEKRMQCNDHFIEIGQPYLAYTMYHMEAKPYEVECQDCAKVSLGAGIKCLEGMRQPLDIGYRRSLQTLDMMLEALNANKPWPADECWKFTRKQKAEERRKCKASDE